MKIVFLDIDGVLNHTACKVKAPSGFCFVDDKCIVRLKRIIEKTDAKVVLASTWRRGYFDLLEGNMSSAAKDYEALRGKLQEFGIDIYDHTPILRRFHRASEILRWLQNANIVIESFVILDDCEDMYPLERYHIKTSFSTGLKVRHVIDSIKRLNNPGI